MKRTTLDKFRENLRLQQVYNVLLRYAWDIGVYDRYAVLKHGLPHARFNQQELAQLEPESLADEIRGIYKAAVEEYK